MATGLSLTLRRIQPRPRRIWSPEAWSVRRGKWSGDPTQWPKGQCPAPRRERRQRVKARKVNKAA